MELQEYDWIVGVVIGNDGMRGLVVSEEGSTFVTTNGGDTWKSANLKLQEDDRIAAAVISNNGMHGLVVSRKGSVFVTTNGGDSWESANLKLGEREQIAGAVISNDGKHGLLAFDRGPVFVTVDSGRTWNITEWDDQVGELTALVSVSLANDIHVAVAVDRSGGAYFLANHLDLAEWRTWALSDAVNELVKNNRVRDSRLFQEIKTFVNDGGSDNDNRRGNGSGTDIAEKSLTGILGELTVMRTVTLTVLFFLVHLLVRLYQYSLRLASFWESRSDAVLLAQSFAEDKAKVFDDLVRALAPDAYDFKSMPRSTLDWPWPRRNP